MDEAKDPKATDAGRPPERDAEATSSATLSDLEENETVKSTGSTGSQLEGSSPSPSPDGGRADGSDTGGPM